MWAVEDEAEVGHLYLEFLAKTIPTVCHGDDFGPRRESPVHCRFGTVLEDPCADLASIELGQELLRSRTLSERDVVVWCDLGQT